MTKKMEKESNSIAPSFCNRCRGNEFEYLGIDKSNHGFKYIWKCTNCGEIEKNDDR